MVWELRYQRDGYSIEAAQRKGRPLPKWYLDEPDVPPYQNFFLSEFWKLSTERGVGMGAGPIPISKIEDRATRIGLSPGMIKAYVSIEQSLDAAYLDWWNKENERKRRKA